MLVFLEQYLPIALRRSGGALRSECPAWLATTTTLGSHWFQGPPKSITSPSLYLVIRKVLRVHRGFTLSSAQLVAGL